ncbi:MAG: hypothetical protein KC442_17910, partial [Thermomicrobiales bacterium]|nr:hypothetical protein [Thermomicrobiales bacterium]
TTISQSDLHHAVDYTNYEGMQVRGLPRTVTLRGQVIAQDREFVGEPGGGQFLRRGPSGVTTGTAGVAAMAAD